MGKLNDWAIVVYFSIEVKGDFGFLQPVGTSCLDCEVGGGDLLSPVHPLITRILFMNQFKPLPRKILQQFFPSVVWETSIMGMKFHDFNFSLNIWGCGFVLELSVDLSALKQFYRMHPQKQEFITTNFYKEFLVNEMKIRSHQVRLIYSKLLSHMTT